MMNFMRRFGDKLYSCAFQSVVRLGRRNGRAVTQITLGPAGVMQSASLLT